MPRSTGEMEVECTDPKEAKDILLIDIKLIKKVKLVSTGRIQCHQYLDVTMIKEEDDGTYTVIVEE